MKVVHLTTKKPLMNANGERRKLIFPDKNSKRVFKISSPIEH